MVNVLRLVSLIRNNQCSYAMRLLVDALPPSRFPWELA